MGLSQLPRRLRAGSVTLLAAVLLAAGTVTIAGDGGARQHRALAAAQTYTVQPGAPIPTLATGDTVVFAPGLQNRTITTPVAGVTYRCAPGAVLSSAGYQLAFYITRPDTTISDCEIRGNRTGPWRVIDGIYVSGADRFKLLRSTIHDGGDDSAFDHGLYIDGSVGFLLEDVTVYGWAANGIQFYSGSGKQTTGTVLRVDVYGNGLDGLHFGAASTNIIVNGFLSHGNSRAGVYSYKGSGNRLEGPGNIWGNPSAILKTVPIYVGPDVELAPGTLQHDLAHTLERLTELARGSRALVQAVSPREAAR